MPKEIDYKEIDLIYNDYIRVMTCAHEKLRSLYNSYVTRFLNEDKRNEHKLFEDTSRLILPGEEDDLTKMFEEPSIVPSAQPPLGGASGGPGPSGEEATGGQAEENKEEEKGCNLDETVESFSERKA